MASSGVMRNNVFSFLHSHDSSNWLSSSTTTLPTRRQKFSRISVVQQDNNTSEKKDISMKTENGRLARTLKFTGEKPSTRMAVARDLLGKNNHVISVIGDGAMTAGQAFEGLNNAGFLESNLIIILNNNNQVSLPTATLDGPAPPVGALSKALTRLQAIREFRQLAKVESYSRALSMRHRACLFEELGVYYIGPVDGHSLEDLVYTFEKVKEMPAPGPVLIHIVTEKGKGYPPAEAAADKLHGVVKFDVRTGKQMKSKSKTQSYTEYFAESLIAEAE